MKSLAGTLLLLVVAGGLVGCDDEARSPRVVVNGHTFTVEVASTPEAVRRGLGGRTGIPEEHGMLFVFDDAAPRQFWMKDCYVPIDVAFISADGRILNVDTMPVELDPARPQHLYDSDGPAKYVLETAGGTWSRLGIKAGMTVSLKDVPTGH